MGKYYFYKYTVKAWKHIKHTCTHITVIIDCLLLSHFLARGVGERKVKKALLMQGFMEYLKKVDENLYSTFFIGKIYIVIYHICVAAHLTQ